MTETKDTTMQPIKCLTCAEAEGKTIKTILEGYDGEMLLVFSDGSVMQLYGATTDADVNASVERNLFFFPLDFRIAELEKALGDLRPDLIAYIKAKKANDEAELKALMEKRRREEYQKLKAEFEPS